MQERPEICLCASPHFRRHGCSRRCTHQDARRSHITPTSYCSASRHYCVQPVIMPDVNSINTALSSSPSSPSSSSRTRRMSGSPIAQRPRRISIDAARPSPPSPRSPSLSSLQAAAAINAGLHRSPGGASPSLQRRRSSLLTNIALNDSTVPAPGELQHANGSNTSSRRMSRRSFAMATADPHHQRQPSLGELHQELENEQEAQVNRLLHMIRLQQDQLVAMQRPAEQAPAPSNNPGFPNPPSTLPTPASTAVTEQSSPRSASISHFNRPSSLSRHSSGRLSSRGNSPALRPQRAESGSLGPLTEDFLLGGTRDESAFYQAETQMLTRENQMLKLRIRELGNLLPQTDA